MTGHPGGVEVRQAVVNLLARPDIRSNLQRLGGRLPEGTKRYVARGARRGVP